MDFDAFDRTLRFCVTSAIKLALEVTEVTLALELKDRKGCTGGGGGTNVEGFFFFLLRAELSRQLKTPGIPGTTRTW